MSEQPVTQTRQEIEAHIVAKAWKDEAYKQELLSNPKAIFEQEFGVELPPEINVKVLEENPTSLYFVLPVNPMEALKNTELSEAELEAVSGGYAVGGVFKTVMATLTAFQASIFTGILNKRK